MNSCAPEGLAVKQLLFNDSLLIFAVYRYFLPMLSWRFGKKITQNMTVLNVIIYSSLQKKNHFSNWSLRFYNLKMYSFYEYFLIRKLHNLKAHFSFRFLHVYKLKMSSRMEQDDNDIFFILYDNIMKIMKNVPVQAIFTGNIFNR